MTIPRYWTNERGVTLVELTIVGVIASFVMAGLVGFYMSSQATWMDGSTQAITQREATSFIEGLSAQVRQSSSALTPDGNLYLYDAYGNQRYGYIWDAENNEIREGIYVGGVMVDPHPSMTSAVERFEVSYTEALVVVTIELRSAQDQLIELSTSAVMQNRVTP